MKVQNKSIIAIGAAVVLFTGSAIADDFNTVISVDQIDVSNSVNQNVVNPDVTIQDYVNTANQNNPVRESSIAVQSSSWEANRTL